MPACHFSDSMELHQYIWSKKSGAEKRSALLGVEPVPHTTPTTITTWYTSCRPTAKAMAKLSLRVTEMHAIMASCHFIMSSCHVIVPLCHVIMIQGRKIRNPFNPNSISTAVSMQRLCN